MELNTGNAATNGKVRKTDLTELRQYVNMPLLSQQMTEQQWLDAFSQAFAGDTQRMHRAYPFHEIFTQTLKSKYPNLHGRVIKEMISSGADWPLAKQVITDMLTLRRTNTLEAESSSQSNSILMTIAQKFPKEVKEYLVANPEIKSRPEASDLVRVAHIESAADATKKTLDQYYGNGNTPAALPQVDNRGREDRTSPSSEHTMPVELSEEGKAEFIDLTPTRPAILSQEPVITELTPSGKQRILSLTKPAKQTTVGADKLKPVFQLLVDEGEVATALQSFDAYVGTDILPGPYAQLALKSTSNMPIALKTMHAVINKAVGTGQEVTSEACALGAAALSVLRVMGESHKETVNAYLEQHSDFADNLHKLNIRSAQNSHAKDMERVIREEYASGHIDMIEAAARLAVGQHRPGYGYAESALAPEINTTSRAR